MKKPASKKKDKLDFTAIMTEAEVRQGEDRWNGSGEVAINRRITMHSLSRSRAQLVEGFRDDVANGGVVLLETIERIGDYVSMLELALQFAKTAQARLFTVGDVLSGGAIGILAAANGKPASKRAPRRATANRPATKRVRA